MKSGILQPMKNTTTCIAALKHEGSVWMAGDSAGVGGLSIVTRSDKKVFLKHDITGNPFGMGFTTSFRMGQLLQYTLTVPAIPSGKDRDLHEYMVTSFIQAVRQCLKDGGFSTITNNEEKAGIFLVGVQGRIFYIDEDFQVGENLPDYSACGCGEDLALGSLYTSKDLDWDPAKKLITAISAASEFSAGVRPPITIIEVTQK